MFLNSIIIDSFACFKHFTANFTSGTNVIIGRNGAGKTSLIKGLVYLMNFLFTNDRSMGDNFLSSGNPDLKMSSIKYNEFYRFKESGESVEYSNLHGKMTFEGEDITWDMYKKSVPGASLFPSKYVTAYRQIMTISKEKGKLPLLAYFSDSFPHKQTNISTFAKSEINNTEGILRNFGYYQWDNETSCTTIWQMRLLNVMAKSLSLDEPNSVAAKEVEYISETLKSFSHTINDEADDSFEIVKVFFSFKDGEKPELWLKLKSSQELAFDMLPAGYHRLYSMVLDLAYRSYLINRKNPKEAIGLVLIDEVDLHLHPSLAMEVVERFQKSFPGIQFIMTTHSPLVVTSLKAEKGKNQVLRLVTGEKKPHILPDLYGIDYNAGLSDALGVNPTNEDMTYIKNSLRRAYQRNDSDLIEAKLGELRKLVSEERVNAIVEEIRKRLI